MKALATTREAPKPARAVPPGPATDAACLPTHPWREAVTCLAASGLLVAGLVLALPASLPASSIEQDILSISCWLLVMVGVLGTFLAGRGVTWGWLLLLGLQPLWITYAVATDQQGLILGSLAYGAAQLNGFVKTRKSVC